MGRALPRVAGTDAVLSQELDELARGNVPTSDPRWLELYARARRFEDIVSAARRIWLGDLRCEYERQAAELVRSKASSNDPRWAALTRLGRPVRRARQGGARGEGRGPAVGRRAAGRGLARPVRRECARWPNSLPTRSRGGAA